jgi:hypothetical protein
MMRGLRQSLACCLLACVVPFAARAQTDPPPSETDGDVCSPDTTAQHGTPPVFDLAALWGYGHAIELGGGARLTDVLPIPLGEWLPGLQLYNGTSDPFVLVGLTVIEHGPKPGLELIDHRTRMVREDNGYQINPEDGRTSPSFRPWIRMDWTFQPCLGKHTKEVGFGASLFVDARVYNPGAGAFVFWQPALGVKFIGEVRELPYHKGFQWDPTFSFRVRFGVAANHRDDR